MSESHCDDTSEYQSAPTSPGDVTSDASACQSVPICSEDATSKYMDMGPITVPVPLTHASESAPSKAEANISDVLLEILDTVRRATTSIRDAYGPQQRFWESYKTTAEEYDTEFFSKYGGDLDASMIFAGLFSAVAATILTMTNSTLTQDPNSITQALLQSIVISLNSSASPLLVPVVPTWAGPNAMTIWIQSLLYVSLACSLFAALAAVLGKQWLSYYRSVGERGDITTRAMERHRKFVGLETWHLRIVLEMIPILLQLSLILFCLSICAYVWSQQRIVGVVVIIANGIGTLCYLVALAISSLYKDSPFQTPLSTVLSRLVGLCGNIVKRLLLLPFDLPSHAAQFVNIVYVCLRATYSVLRASAQGCVRLLSRCLNPRYWRTLLTGRQGSETSMLPFGPDIEHLSSMVDIDMSTMLPDGAHARDQEVDVTYMEQDSVVTSAVHWLLITSTDVQVQADIWRMIPSIPWSSYALQQLPISVLDRLLMDIRTCYAATVDSQGNITRLDLVPSRHDVTLNVTSAFLFLLWEKLAESYDETMRWICKISVINALHPYTLVSLSKDDGSENLHLIIRLFAQTVSHLRQVGERMSMGKPTGRSLLPVVSFRSHYHLEIGAVCARTAVYLAQQAAVHSVEETKHEPRRSSVPWGAEELMAYQRDILSICNDLSKDTQQSLYTCVLTVLASLTVTNEEVRFPVCDRRGGITDDTTSLAITTFEAIRGILKKLEEYLLELSDPTSLLHAHLEEMRSSRPLLRAIVDKESEHRKGEITIRMTRPLMLLFTESLGLVPVICERVSQSMPAFPLKWHSAPMQAKLMWLYEDALPSQCFSTLVALSNHRTQTRSDIDGCHGDIMRFLLQLNLRNAPPFVDARLPEECRLLNLSKEWIPQDMLLQRWSNLDEDKLCVLVYQMLNVISRPETSRTSRHHALILISCIPSLGCILRGHVESLQCAVSFIKEAFAASAHCSSNSQWSGWQWVSDDLFAQSRSTTCLIHALMNPLYEGAISPEELIMSLELSASDFCESVYTVLRVACGAQFYCSTDHFLGPDEMATDILIWFSQLGLSSIDTRCRDGYISLWSEISMRVLEALSSHRIFFPLRVLARWKQPSDHLQSNLWSLLILEGLWPMGVGSDNDAERASRDAHSGVAQEIMEGRTRGAELDKGICRAALQVAQAQLSRWYHDIYTLQDPNPSDLLDFTVHMLAQELAGGRVAAHLDFRSNLKSCLMDIRENPDRLFRDVVEDGKREHCISLLELMDAMLTFLPEDLDEFSRRSHAPVVIQHIPQRVLALS